MSLQECYFLLGRAGSGKTWRVLSSIAEELCRAPLGVPLLLLTPEQSTAQLERRLATWPGLLGGTTRARVFSFHHLAREAFLRAGGAPGRQLGDVGRIMLLRQAMLRRQAELAALGQSATQPGVAETISRTLLEFQRYGWRLSDVETWLADEILQGAEQNLTVRKVRDLAILWRDFEMALAAGQWEDPARIYERAAAAIRRSRWLEGARVWVDGFASFTSLEMTVFEALLEKASRVVFALCLDPRQLALKESSAVRSRIRIGQERLFENNEETFFTIRNRLIDLGLPEGKIRIEALPAEGQATRFSATPALVHLERRVLGRMNPAPCPEEAWNASPDAPLELIEASDRRAEVEAVARRIVTACRRDPSAPESRPLLLWREIAVLARDLTPYEVHLREVFGAFRIPFFFDRPRSVRGHSLVRSILSALAVLRTAWSGDAVLQHLKSGLCGLKDEDAIGLIENAIRATDPHGAQWLPWLEQDEGLHPAWREVAEPLRQLDADLRTESAPRALWKYLEAIQAAARLEEWIAAAQARGDEETVQIHEQAWEQTVQWLEEFEKVQGALSEIFPRDEGRSHRERIQEIIDLVEAALATTQARLIPPTLNQVTVGAVDRSRTPEVKTAFVIGMNEGEFPKLWQPDAMLGDEERALLTHKGKQLGPDSQRKRLQEHFLAYIALTRPGARLIVSRPQVDDEGRVCNPSPYFALLAQVYPKAALIQVKRCGEGDIAELPLRPEEWAMRLSLQLASGHDDSPEGTADVSPTFQGGDSGKTETQSPAGTTDVTPAFQGGGLKSTLARIQSLLHHPGLDQAQRRGLERAHARLSPPTPVRLSTERAAGFWTDGAMLPVTALESYGECPFKFFTQRMLRLAPRQEAALNILELGTLRHDILDQIFRKLRGPEGLDWGTIDLEAADQLIDEEVRRLRGEAKWRARLEASALGGMALETVGEETKLFVRALRLAGRRCQFVQVESEWTFGRGGELAIAAGERRIGIRGTVDRIDALANGNGSKSPGSPPIGLLIDYKSGRRRLSLAKILEGIDLQLLTYALAWRRAYEANGGRAAQIGGVFYWPLAAPVREAQPDDGGADGEAVDAGWFRELKPSGIFVDQLADQLDAEVTPGGSALAFGFRKTSSGALHGGGQNHWPREGLAMLLEHEEKLLSRLAEKIIAGRIEIAPYCLGKTMPCDMCDFSGVCRKADAPGEVRRIEAVKRDQALEFLKSTAAEMD